MTMMNKEITQEDKDLIHTSILYPMLRRALAFDQKLFKERTIRMGRVWSDAVIPGLVQLALDEEKKLLHQMRLRGIKVEKVIGKTNEYKSMIRGPPYDFIVDGKQAKEQVEEIMWRAVERIQELPWNSEPPKE